MRRGFANLPQLTGLPGRDRGRGRPSTADTTRFELECVAFAQLLNGLLAPLSFKPSVRGCCYLLEQHRLINKGEFGKAEGLINDLRKNGTLPLDMVAEDGRRMAEGIEQLNGTVPVMIEAWENGLLEAPDTYRPISFWDDLPVYVEIAVEKVDLKGLFGTVCEEYNIVIQNVGGWADLNVRYQMLVRFYKHWSAGRQIVLGYCGDHDPGGLNISDWLPSNLKDIAGAVARHVGVATEVIERMVDELVIEHFGLNKDFTDRMG